VAVVGVSGSGKTSLAIGTLYAEGVQRFLESLSTYSRRRLSQAQRPDVDRIDHLPPALALRQRPPIPGRRSTVGTMSEVLNVLRLMMSRLGSHLCPNGHRVEPTTGLHPLDVATLVGVFDRLLEAGATIIVIDHDLDLLAAADHLIDMGPGGGPDGGRILAAGTPQDVTRTSDSVTGPWLAEQFGVPRG
jgi:excinuclease UvrABC ATPase subunit